MNILQPNCMIMTSDFITTPALGLDIRNNVFHPQQADVETADTHVLVRAHQEAVMNVSFHQAGLSHTLLSQHHHFGVHTDGTHSNGGRNQGETESI